MKKVIAGTALLLALVVSESYAQQGGGGGGRFRDMTPVEASAIPAPITTYVKEKYPQVTVRRTFKDKEENYHVMVVAADSTRKRLVFDAKGAFKEEQAGGRGGQRPPRENK
ncbi:hypothetical protein [Tellurirhabdus bombi]|uniref:hypothetical protein n=1 Tax=Tellurirhabdus bombi TaxID=2907205 RepID=UPI001F179BFB|nr:hypothetical protein [Tellurirhabdus bombi]